MNYLLIGNGPSALASGENGKLIDDFPGMVVRFNAYKTTGMEKNVGTRTDIWATVGDVGGCRVYKHKARWWLNGSRDPRHEIVRERLGAEVLEPNWRHMASQFSGTGHPSSGLLICAHLLSKGHQVTLYGFDFMNEMRKHHYADKADRGPWHDGRMEWLYFARLLDAGRIGYLGFNNQEQSIPLVRLPVPCGTDENLSSLRDPGQMGWYAWACDRMTAGESVLDVGAGTCTGLNFYREKGLAATGFDTDVRLRHYDPTLLIGDDLSGVGDRSFDWVSCIDVLEHIPNDLVAFRHLLRIARKGVFITTPNGNRSHCVNGAHCREWTFHQYLNIFDPHELWTGSPDGKLHLTQLFARHGNFIIDRGAEGPDNERPSSYYRAFPRFRVPAEATFCETVDGQEWPHIAAIHRIG